MRDASGMIGRTEARAASFPPRPSLCVGDTKRVHRKRTGTGSIPWRSIRSITAHSHDLCREIGAFGGTGELHLLLDRCVGQRARGTCCPPFLRFENRVNGEWAEQKGRRSSYGVAHLSSAGDWRMGRAALPWGRQNHRRSLSSFFLERRAPWYVIKNGRGADFEWRREAAR